MKKGSEVKPQEASRPFCRRAKLFDAVPDELQDIDDYYVHKTAMRKYYFLDGKRVSAKLARELLGLTEFQRALAIARVEHYVKPELTYTINTSSGELEIRFMTI